MKILSILFLLVSFVTQTHAESHLAQVFSVKKPIMVALYLRLPKDLNNQAEIQQMIDYGVSQVEIMERHGVESILWEYGVGGIMTPAVSEREIEIMAQTINGIKAKTSSLKLGVEVLWHYPYETLKLAALTNADFVRIDFFSDPMTADGVIVPMESEAIINYKNMVGASKTKLFTDIQVKYAEMIDSTTTMTESAERAINSGSQGVIVSGRKSGQPPALSDVGDAKNGARTYDVIIGSGFSIQNGKDLLQFADGIIVGTSISVKTGGPLVEDKVRELMDFMREYRKNL
jgi:uncharacterized protein